MPLREKLRKVFHREHEDGEDSSPRASQELTGSPRSGAQSRRSVDAGRGQKVSTADYPASPKISQGSPATGRRSSAAAPPASRFSVDHQTASPTSARRSEDVMTHARTPSNAQAARYSEDVADWNIVKSTKPHDKSAVPAPLQVNRELNRQHDHAPSAVTSGRTRGESVSRKAVASPSSSSPIGVAVTSSSAIPADKTRHHLERQPSTSDLKEQASLDRLPPAELPVRDMAVSKHIKEYAVKDAAEAPSLSGILDLTNTVDTTVDERWAPAVTHETVRKNYHHIREEVITREIHNYDIYHRILPIIDVEILPARHFVPDGKGGLVEISEAEIPGRVGPYKQSWVIMENVSTGEVPREPRRFTAREFKGAEGDFKEYVNDKGIPTTETTWVHPPTLAEYGQMTGQTVPFYFNSPDPKDDGLHAYAPRGPVSGSSRLLAEGGQRPMTPPEEEMGKLSLNGTATKVSPRNFSHRSDNVLTPPQTATRAGFETDDSEDPRLARA